MKKLTSLFILTSTLLFISCDQYNINKDIESYTATWDEIVNNENLELFNEDNFTSDVTFIMSPDNLVGIEAAKEYYSNFISGFSNKEFTIISVFGQGDKIVKHWKFKGNHTGDFFGIPATGNLVELYGTTLVKMKGGKIAEEEDFFDNHSFLQQLGIVSNPENTGIIQGVYDSFSKGDIPSVLGALDANVIWNEAENNAYADGNPYIGPDAVLKGVFQRVGSEHEYFKLADIQLHEMSNNQVLATMRYQAKLNKNGAIINAQAAHLWTLKSGKVIAFQQYVDTKQLDDAINK